MNREINIENGYVDFFWHKNKVWNKKYIICSVLLNIVTLTVSSFMVALFYCIFPFRFILIAFGFIALLVNIFVWLLFIISYFRKDFSCYDFD